MTLFRDELRRPYGSPAMLEDAMWRIEAKRYSVVIDPEREEYGVSGPHIEAHWFKVVKRTKCGAWITTPWGSDKRFVNLERNKRFARNTIDEAFESFLARKQRQVSILTTQARHAQGEHDKAKAIREWINDRRTVAN